MMESLAEDFCSEALSPDDDDDVNPAEDKDQGESKSQQANVRKNLSKNDRKQAKKSWRMTQIVGQQIGVKISSEPYDWLVIWGVGLASGVSKATILEYFQPKPVEVRVFVDQTYVLVRCANENDAISLRNQYHGKNYDERQTLYVGFVERLVEIPKEDCSFLKTFGQSLPEGLLHIPEFITTAEEETISSGLYVEHSTGSQLKKRTVQHFGYEFRYGTNDVDINSPLPYDIPDYIKPVVNRMVSSGAVPTELDQLTVNQYAPGQGIPPHCDTHSCFEGPIVSLSLGSEIVMDFRKGDQIRSLSLPPRGLLVMSGECRYGWTHGITPRKWDVIPDKTNGGITIQPRKLRISLTFRRLKRGERVCECG